MLANKICNDKDLNELEPKDLILETIVATLERIPSIVHDNPNGEKIVNTVIELILNYMIENISPNIE